MSRFASRSILGVFATILASFLSSPSSLAFTCIELPACTVTPGLPLCTAAPGSSVCSNDASRQCRTNPDCTGGGTCVGAALGVGGTVTANPNTINTVALSGPTNVSLSISSTPGSVVTFRAVQTNPALDAQAIVLATDSANHTCTVPVSFHVRSLGPANNEAICNLAELYSLDVVSVAGSPSLPAGTTVCSSHLANCPGGLPGGYTFLNDSRILTVRSPIAGLADMKLTRTGTYDDHLRLMFSRSTDSGANFTALEDVTTDVSPGSSVIRGKGQWSDVKVIAARIGCIAPAVSEWGVIVLSLLMMTALAILVTRRRLVPAGSGMQVDAPSLFVPRVFAGALAGTEALAVVALSASWFLGFSSTPTDVVGSLVSAGIVAYLVHLWRVLSYSSRRTG